jgi:hypothetical protein
MWTFVIAIAAAASLLAGVQWKATWSPVAVAFSYADTAISADPIITRELGNPVSLDELATIKQMSRAELERAFAGLPVRLTDSGRGFWRVRVVPSVMIRSPRGRPMAIAAGTSYGFGPLGGGAFVNFNTIAANARRYAPPNATRQQILEGVGRGIGHAAVHELAHMIGLPVDTRTDEGSYEYFSADRASQYYGTLHWNTPLPMLLQKIGR